MGTVRYPIDDIPPFDSSQLRPGPLHPSVLYILVDYADTPATYTDVASWASQITSKNVNAKTIADYYQEASYGAVSISPARESDGTPNDGVIGWLRLNSNHPGTKPVIIPEGDSDMLKDIAKAAFSAADPFIDFASYDLNKDTLVDPTELAVVIVVAGHEAATPLSGLPTIWARATSNIGVVQTSDTVSIFETQRTPISSSITSKPGYHGPTEICEEVLVEKKPVSFMQVAEMGEIHDSNHQATLGIPVHELGHLIFGLPDLYDLDPGESGQGLGGFGLMGAGAWGADPTTDAYAGETPVLPSAWSQYKLEWVTAQAWGPLVSAGRNSIPDAKPVIGIAHVGSDSGGFLKCSASEYFLMQYRADVGYDRGLRIFLSAQDNSFTPGLLILHVDESQNTNSVNSRRLVDVEEANGLEVGFSPPADYNKHLWFDGNYTLFNETTAPNSNPNSSSGFSALDSSGVEVEALNSFVSSNGDESIHVRINSVCDAPRFEAEKK